MPKLTYTVAGERKSVEVTDSASIGRLPENQVPLPDEVGASRRHCQILKIAGGYEVSDLGSTNGTKVNGQKIKRHKLKDGDVITIGDTSVTWSDGTGAAEDEVVLEGDVGSSAPAPAASRAAPSGGGTSEQCFLVFAGGPKDGERVPLEKKRITFGRNAKNTFTFADDMGVSGYHCEVTREGGAYVLRDLGSTNGTLVDGEQVTEIALQHGNRIRIGGQRLVFVDPTISDFEKAMASVDDLGSEWGLLRAEMDMSRVQQARRSQLLAIGAVIVVLVGAAYVVIMNPQLLGGGKQAPTPIAGNVVPDFSFEGGTASWAVLPGSPGSGRYGTSADAGSDAAPGWYVVARENAAEAGRGAAVALSGENVTVNPESAYEIGAKVRTKSGGLGAVRVTWLRHDGAPVGESATNLSDSAEWSEVQATVTPPADSANARIELVNAGVGTAQFDDVFFRPAASRPAAQRAESGSVSLTATSDGQATLRRGNVVLLRDLAAIGGGSRADATEPSKRSDRVGSRKGTGVSGGKVSGKAWDAGRSKWADFSYTLGATDERYATIDVQTLGEDAALVAVLPKEFVDQGLAVRTDEGRFFRMSDARAVDKVRSVQVGEKHVFKVAADEGSPAFRFILFRSGDQWNVAFAGSAFKLKIDTDSAAIKSAADDLKRQARDAVQRREFGKAVKFLRELGNSLPQGSQEAQDALDEAARLEKSGSDELAAVTAGRGAAVEFQDDSELDALKGRAQKLAKEYADHAVGEAGGKEIASIEQALEKRRLVLDERTASPMLEKAKDFEAQKDVAVARALYDSIVAAYPRTAAAAEAKKRLASLPTAGN